MPERWGSSVPERCDSAVSVGWAECQPLAGMPPTARLRIKASQTFDIVYFVVVVFSSAAIVVNVIRMNQFFSLFLHRAA